jgi:hypothetical protein
MRMKGEQEEEEEEEEEMVVVVVVRKRWPKLSRIFGSFVRSIGVEDRCGGGIGMCFTRFHRILPEVSKLSANGRRFGGVDPPIQSKCTAQLAASSFAECAHPPFTLPTTTSSHHHHHAHHDSAQHLAI